MTYIIPEVVKLLKYKVRVPYSTDDPQCVREFMFQRVDARKALRLTHSAYAQFSMCDVVFYSFTS